MVRRSLGFALVALALLALPLPAGAALPGTHHASRAYLLGSGPQRGELAVRVIARYPEPHTARVRSTAIPRSPCADRAARCSCTTWIGSRIRAAPSRSITASSCRAPARHASWVRRAAPRTTVTVPLHQVTAYPPVGGRLLASSLGWLAIGYALEPNTAGTYDAVAMSLLAPQGRVLFTDLAAPGNGALRVETADGLRPAGGADFSATFALTSPLPGGCTGSASGRIDAISANYGQTSDFDHATFTSTWSSYQLWPLCATPVTGTMQSLAGDSWVAD